MNNERLTWSQIKEKYPHKYVGLSQVEYKEDGVNIKSAIVLFTSDEKTYDEMMELHFEGKIVTIYTTPEEDMPLGSLAEPTEELFEALRRLEEDS